MVLVFTGCVDNDEADASEPAIGRQGVLARGTVPDDERDWVLEASLDGESLCLEFLGTSCIAIPEDGIEQGLLAVSGFDRRGSYSCAYGPLFREVATVQVEFADGTIANGRIIPGQGWATNFYVACIGRNKDVRDVTLLDADGAQLVPAS